MWRKITLLTLLEIFLVGTRISAGVDTLMDTSEVRDCQIYSYANCNLYVSDEDCRRYNAGSIVNMAAGNVGASNERRSLIKFPGWNGILPDSSKLKLYCCGEEDSNDRYIFAYPLTTCFMEGSENSYSFGDYPDPDSGATWFHAYLDTGDADSSNWNTAGGDYTTAIADTILVSTIDSFYTFEHINRFLEYWDTSGTYYGLILINENLFPANYTAKVFKSSESSEYYKPKLILYYPDSLTTRRRRIASYLSVK